MRLERRVHSHCDELGRKPVFVPPTNPLASSGCHFVRNAFLSTKWVSKGASLNFPVQELSVLSGRIRENRLRVLVTMQVVGFLSPWSRTHGCLNIVPTSYFTLVRIF